MDIRSLRYFEAVYEAGSVSAAARDCFVSQPSISTSICQLEEVLGVNLFIRHPKGVMPTFEAKKLYPLSKELSENVKSILHLFDGSSISTPLRLGVMRSLGSQRMGVLLKGMSDRIENLELTLVDSDEPCDIRIIDSTSLTSNEEFIPIYTDNYLLAIPAGHALRQLGKIELSDLESLPFIYRTTCLAQDELKKLMNKTGIRYHVRANIRTIEYAQSLVSAGVGMALLPDWEEFRAKEDLLLRDIEGVRLKRKVGLAFKKNRADQLLVKSCIKALLQIV